MFLAGDRAYKLKKAAGARVVDYATAERRRGHVPRGGVTQPLAGSRHLSGVRGVAPSETGIELTDDDDPRTVEFVVEMRRYDERGTLDAALASGNVEEDTVGRRLAEFHRNAEHVAVEASVLEMPGRIERNLDELLESLDDPEVRDRESDVLPLAGTPHAGRCFRAGAAELGPDPQAAGRHSRTRAPRPRRPARPRSRSSERRWSDGRRARADRLGGAG